MTGHDVDPFAASIFTDPVRARGVHWLAHMLNDAGIPAQVSLDEWSITYGPMERGLHPFRAYLYLTGSNVTGYAVEIVRRSDGEFVAGGSGDRPAIVNVCQEATS